jgi:phosphoribosylamine--glycine ligase
VITGLDRPDGPSAGSGSENVTVVQAGTALDGDGQVVSAGGRVLAVVGTGTDLGRARAAAYARIATIGLQGSFYRTDIAAAVAAEKQV